MNELSRKIKKERRVSLSVQYSLKRALIKNNKKINKAPIK
jgi:hypothetical protein